MVVLLQKMKINIIKMNIYSLRVYRFWLLFMLAFVSIGVNAHQGLPPGFAPFDSALRGLEKLYFVQQSMEGQRNHHSTLQSVTPAQAEKVLQGMDPALGLTYTPRVYEFLKYYTQPGIRRQVEIMLGLTSSYLPLFESILAEHEMPAGLKYLPMALSSMNLQAVSSWGATGLWQIMYTNGRLYRLQIDSFVDERRDPAKSTKAALQHLNDLYAIYQSWELAIAAYTNSPSNINKAIRKAGGSRDYADLYPWLPVETRDYLPALAACYILVQMQEEIGLTPYTIHNPLQSMRAPVEHRLHLGQAADFLGVSKGLLQDMNPEFKSGVIPAGNERVFWLRLPAEHHARFVEFADSIYYFRDSIYFPTRRGVVMSQASETVAEASAEASADVSEEAVQAESGEVATEAVVQAPMQPAGRVKLNYTVKDGDNLGYIAGWYGVRVSDIRRWNNLPGDIIRVGQVLDIWVPEASEQRYRNIDRMTFAEKQRGATQPASARQTSQPSSGGFSWHTVQRGETISAIAARHPGVTADQIMRLNNIRDPRTLQAGQRIKIPTR